MAIAKCERQMLRREKVVKALPVIFAILLAFSIKVSVEIQDIIITNSWNSNSSKIIVEENEEKVDEELTLTMIDVGQAESFLLENGGKYALIDCGKLTTGKNVVKYLKDNEITYLDYVFITHHHEDHVGGLLDVIRNIKIGKIIMPKIKLDVITKAEAGIASAMFNEMILIGQKLKGYQIGYANVGDTYYLGQASMKIIGMLSNPGSNINNYSTVMKITFGEMDILMTADAEKELEQKILASGQDISAEILKVGHHGSNTSTTEEFLDAISPQYALISSEKGNDYGHPTKRTMKKLEERDIEIYRVDESGTIIATITATDVTFSCEPGDYLSGSELKQK